jgi:hypothetical protein
MSAEQAWVFYFANVWLCARCRHEWCDAAQRRMNAWAAEVAADSAY